MKIFRITSLIIIAILILIAGCSDRDTVKAGKQFSDTILPLAEDNYWIFEDSVFVDGEFDKLEIKKMGITGASQIGYAGETIWVYHWAWYDMPEDKAQIRRSLVRNEDEGLAYYGQKMGSSYTEFARRLFIKYPAEQGEEWTYTEGALIQCVSLETVYETPLGSFQAIEYRMTLGETVQYLYYVPEVGYVGMIEKNNGVIVRKRGLKEYQVDTEDKALSIDL